MMAKIFISHINEESSVANKIKSLVQDSFGADLKVFLSSDYDSLRGGDKWFPTIVENIKSSQMILVLLSHESLHHPWIPYEAGVGEGAGVKVIPLVHANFAIRELAPPLGEYHARNIQNTEGILALIRDIEDVINSKATNINIKELVTEIEILERELSSKAFEPNTYVIEMWFKSVTTPLIRSLEIEQTSLEQPKLIWDSRWKHLEGIRTIRNSLQPQERDRLQHFEKVYSDIKEAIDEHDSQVSNLEEQYLKLHNAIQSGPQLQAVYDTATTPGALSEMNQSMDQQSMDRIFHTSNIESHLKLLAGYIVNRINEPPSGYTPREFWYKNKDKFLAILSYSPLREMVEDADQSSKKLLEIVKRFLIRLREIRDQLSFKHKVPY